MATTYSHSRLNSFGNCPKQYWFNYLSGDKRDLVTIESFLGNRFHETMEKLYEGVRLGRTPELSALLDYYNEIWEQEWTAEVLFVKKDRTAEDYRRVGREAIETYYKRYSPFQQDRTLTIEEKMTFTLDPEEKYKILGLIDRLSKRPDGVWEIHDYKTSASLPTQGELDRDRQLALYEIGIRQKFPRQFERVELVWHYVAFDEEFRSTRTREQLEAVAATTRSLIDEIEAEKTFPTKESYLCNYCAYRPVCPLFKHEYLTIQVEPKAKFALSNEQAIAAVDEYARLDDALKQLEFQKDEIKELIIEFAKTHGLGRVFGKEKQITISSSSSWSFPSTSDKDAEKRAALESALKKMGLWEQVTALETRKLSTLLADPETPEALKKVLLPFAKPRETTTARLAKRKPEKEK